MLKSKKVEVISEIEDIYRNHSNIIITHYHGLTVSTISSLRANLRKNDAGFRVIKNTLAKLAADNVGFKGSNDLFKGPVAIAYSQDPVSVAKSIVEFTKTNSNLKIVGGILDKTVVDAKVIDQMSKLPSMIELRSKIVGLLQAPATKVAGVIGAPATKLARVIQAFSNK